MVNGPVLDHASIKLHTQWHRGELAAFVRPVCPPGGDAMSRGPTAPSASPTAPSAPSSTVQRCTVRCSCDYQPSAAGVSQRAAAASRHFLPVSVSLRSPSPSLFLLQPPSAQPPAPRTSRGSPATTDQNAASSPRSFVSLCLSFFFLSWVPPLVRFPSFFW